MLKGYEDIGVTEGGGGDGGRDFVVCELVTFAVAQGVGGQGSYPGGTAGAADDEGDVFCLHGFAIAGPDVGSGDGVAFRSVG